MAIGFEQRLEALAMLTLDHEDATLASAADAKPTLTALQSRVEFGVAAT